MPFDPNLPADHTHGSAAQMRAQLTGLHAQITAIPQGPPGIQGPPGNNGGPGPQGEQGPPGPPLGSPLDGNIQINGNAYIQAELALFASDPNGSGETSLRLGHTTAGGIPILQLTNRTNGTTVSTLKLDFAGHEDGAGTPTLQHGDIIRHDSAMGSLKPTRDDTARDPTTIQPLTLTLSDPPTLAQVQAILDAHNQLVTALKRA